jgi:CubicO group peptidase (beta-lactamase class C family)
VEPVTAAELDAFAAAYVDRVGLPGAAVAVTHGDRVVHTGGYGHDSEGRPLRADTPLPIASLSKSMTALAVLRLAERGALDLDDPVREHLPEFGTADPRSDRVTVRQLLDQSSGLSDRSLPRDALPWTPRTLPEAVARLAEAEPTAAPGERWQYHNPNYQVAARLVEAVSGEDFADHLQRHVLAPAGMAHTWSAATADPRPEPAQGFIRAYGAHIAVSEPETFSTGSGDVVSTADDMARWLLLHAGGGRVPGGARLLSEESVEQAHTPSAPGGRYALGWMRRTSEHGDRHVQVWHGGVLSTYSSYQVLVPATGYGFVALFNTGIALTENDTWGLVEGLVDLTEGRTPPVGGTVLWKVDAAFGAATLVAAGLGARGMLRAPAWAARRADRPRWRTAARLLPYLVPPVLFPGLNAAITSVMGGRYGTWTERFYGIPAEMAFLATAALVCAAVAGSRALALRRAAVGAPRRGDHDGR